MIPRALSKRLLQAAKRFPIVAITGPRQSGKTTLVREIFKRRPYVNLEDPDQREFAAADPRRFLGSHPKGMVIDEAHRVPELFSYIQGFSDRAAQEGMYVLTGSNNFMLLESITQSLAGRVALAHLLPFSCSELASTRRLPDKLDALMFTGLYPRIHDKKVPPTQWCANYVATYLERDVRRLTKVVDLSTFQKFLRMCAARSGQILNLSALGNDCGISHNTARAWLSILQAGYIAFLLPPYHRNFNKRLIKAPKLYFYDTGLLCYLLGIRSAKELASHSSRGNIFETLIISEIHKSQFNMDRRPELYFWRDHVGHEVDCVLEEAGRPIPLEIKSGETITTDFFSGLDYWRKVSKSKAPGILVYGGRLSQRREGCHVAGWREYLTKSL